MNLKDITDPSDFKTTKLPALAELDILKRCYICKDLLNAPVRTQCDHTRTVHNVYENFYFEIIDVRFVKQRF